jgi:hypothetical protein
MMNHTVEDTIAPPVLSTSSASRPCGEQAQEDAIEMSVLRESARRCASTGVSHCSARFSAPEIRLLVWTLPAVRDALSLRLPAAALVGCLDSHSRRPWPS